MRYNRSKKGKVMENLTNQQKPAKRRVVAPLGDGFVVEEYIGDKFVTVRGGYYYSRKKAEEKANEI